MGIYRCIDCELSYCDSCEPGEDSCKTCRTGPRCEDCAIDHDVTHREEVADA